MAGLGVLGPVAFVLVAAVATAAFAPLSVLSAATGVLFGLVAAGTGAGLMPGRDLHPTRWSQVFGAVLPARRLAPRSQK
jgi:predicted membrane metal-binding protein